MTAPACPLRGGAPAVGTQRGGPGPKWRGPRGGSMLEGRDDPWARWPRAAAPFFVAARLCVAPRHRTWNPRLTERDGCSESPRDGSQTKVLRNYLRKHVCPARRG
ncbi:hypothetical protein B1H19_13520 [Streptomyces gilvosporeus]|uniref:Uncharacterized protein n=1 Tax=Streptomyces gilvosporeus TaxID=553510 RepID=A0A1V0TQI5_9ACTN|nr:hypothetical protein B1H19_13520 [Streptomyces gilvosporeus]